MNNKKKSIVIIGSLYLLISSMISTFHNLLAQASVFSVENSINPKAGWGMMKALFNHEFYDQYFFNQRMMFYMFLHVLIIIGALITYVLLKQEIINTSFESQVVGGLLLMTSVGTILYPLSTSFGSSDHTLDPVFESNCYKIN